MTTRVAATRAPGRFPTPLSVDLASRVPIHRQIYLWFQAAIVDGRLGPGQDVPSSRGLAKELGVSRAPVLAAFDQLAAEGYVVGAVGAGTRVARTIPEASKLSVPRSARPAETRSAPRRASRRAEATVSSDAPWQEHPGAFRASLPALDRFPAAQWGAIVARHARASSPAMLGYGDPMGHRPLREAIAAYLGASRGVRCPPERVMVVSGSQQGLQISARALMDPGDAILVEDPGYSGARSAFGSAGLEVVPVPLDEQGFDVAEGRRKGPGARAAYVTPSHQYPMGVGMGAARRLELLRWAVEASAWVIEDDYDSEFRFGARPVMALQGIDAAGRVVYVGTFSKVMFPALRVGYLVVPDDMVTPFAAVRESLDIFPPTLVQAALAEFIAEGHFARHLRRMRVLYERRRQELVRCLAERLSPGCEVLGIEAGMHVALLLPPDRDDMDVARRAAAAGLSTIPLSTCRIGPPGRPGLLLGYGNVEEAAIAPAVDLLAGVVEAGAPTARVRPVVIPDRG